MVSPSGIITTIAGSGDYGFLHGGFSGDGGSATSATMNDPTGVAVDASGNLFIADFLNNRIRRVSPSGIITTVAGSAAILA
jgi:DNA-binding beta-propeller fold protein YncE